MIFLNNYIYDCQKVPHAGGYINAFELKIKEITVIV